MKSALVALLFIAIASLRIAATYQIFSFTIDEPGHFACGLEYLSKHVYRYETQHPPLARASMRAPARCAMPSAVRRCSAAGRRWR